MLVSGDPMMDVVNIPFSSYHNTEMFRCHRNVLLLEVKEGNPDKVYFYKDEYAAPQVIFEVAASSRRTLDSLLDKVAPRVLAEMRDGEHRRIIKAFHNDRGVKQMKTIREKFGIGLTVSQEFEVAVMEPDFAWVRKETKDFGIGVLLHRLPYTDKRQLEPERLMDALDTMMRHHVPGPAEGSYMGLERKNWDVTHRQTRLADLPAEELRGMWRTFGDFMGGPFVSYIVVEPGNKTLLLLTAYAYAPRETNSMPFPKRDLLMQVESICHSLEF